MTTKIRREQRILTITKEHNLTGKFVEVGVLKGTFSKCLLKCNPSELYLIDPWIKWPDEVFKDYKSFTQESYDNLYEDVKKKFEKHENVKVIRDVSMNAVQQFQDESLDLVYIDANHDYEYCLEDLKAWWPKVRRGGILCGHDFQNKGVNRALNEFTKEVGINEFETTDEVGCATYFLIK